MTPLRIIQNEVLNTTVCPGITITELAALEFMNRLYKDVGLGLIPVTIIYCSRYQKLLMPCIMGYYLLLNCYFPPEIFRFFLKSEGKEIERKRKKRDVRGGVTS